MDVDKFFDFTGIIKNLQVKMVAVCLKGVAYKWWERIILQRQQQGKWLVKHGGR